MNRNQHGENAAKGSRSPQFEFAFGNGFSSMRNNFPQATAMVNRMYPYEIEQTATSDRAVLQQQTSPASSQQQPMMIQRQIIEPAAANSSGRIIFPVKLHEILSDHTIADIISWQPHGRSWRVHKPLDFEKHVIHR
eukprot:CAMPEP_0196813170 /NCGR_PEP_ID=MMETSP1362-20130617/34305_1 /TAXON_ID=163516 /ORGANISM="Leptocylindrus danicus, Strain CCMP1856" /LENGTH=135 /DNA_ID=CAMNT_0042189237 /DNA_START=1 /DNA_END=404 /DNA_ORIENTATION=-